MFKTLKDSVLGNWSNVRGWRSSERIIVFQSDDWGSQRMPSKEIFAKLLKKGISVNRSRYNRLDTLESRKDLNALFNLLKNYKDKNGKHPLFNFNTVMGNPDYDKIRQNRFKRYFHEPMFSSYENYLGRSAEDLWFSAIEENIMRPQFHAREHLNVALWMKALRAGHSETLTAFQHNFCGLNTDTPSKNQKNYLAAYWAESPEEYSFVQEITEKGLSLFNETFGEFPKSFVACNYVYPLQLEQALNEAGVRSIEVQRGHLAPDLYKGNNKIIRRYTGEYNSNGMIYLMRNCKFEPSLAEEQNSVSNCLKDIERAFRWNKPAIISTHRINYVSGIDHNNRDRGLSELKKLIDSILKIWPEVVFMGTDELVSLINNTQR